MSATAGEASGSSSGDRVIQAPLTASSVKKQPIPSSKRKRNLPGTPDPDAEVVALSPRTLLATNRFVCEICNKGFRRDQNLQLHRRGHNLPWKLKQRTEQDMKKRVYVCPDPTCVHHDPARALSDLTGIKKHYCRKHGDKKWKCDKCSKRYAVQSDWKAHLKSCGTREYRCDCGFLFCRRDSFITHRAFCDSLLDENTRVSASQEDESSDEPGTGYAPEEECAPSLCYKENDFRCSKCPQSSLPSSLTFGRHGTSEGRGNFKSTDGGVETPSAWYGCGARASTLGSSVWPASSLGPGPHEGMGVMGKDGANSVSSWAEYSQSNSGSPAHMTAFLSSRYKVPNPQATGLPIRPGDGKLGHGIGQLTSLHGLCNDMNHGPSTSPIRKTQHMASAGLSVRAVLQTATQMGSMAYGSGMFSQRDTDHVEDHMAYNQLQIIPPGGKVNQGAKSLSPYQGGSNGNGCHSVGPGPTEQSGSLGGSTSYVLGPSNIFIQSRDNLHRH